jgi:hypothetical protein
MSLTFICPNPFRTVTEHDFEGARLQPQVRSSFLEFRAR